MSLPTAAAYAGQGPPAAAASATALDMVAATFSDQDLALIVKGIMATGETYVVITQPASAMPREDPIVHYAGRSADGKPTIWMIDQADAKSYPPQDYGRAYTAAYGLSAMDSGAAGPVWKHRFDAATDRVLLGQGFARAFELQSDRVGRKSREDIAWIHATIKPGMSRTSIYKLLNEHGLQPATRWDDSGKKHIGMLVLATGFNLACGYEIIIEFFFDTHDDLTATSQSKEGATCL